MYLTLFFVYALFVSLSNSFLWKPVERSVSSSSPWNEADTEKQKGPRNIILFLGQPSNSHECKKEDLNNTEPEYFTFSTITSVKSCLKENATHSESFSPTQLPVYRSAQQKCDHCEKALQQAVSDLMDFATNVHHIQSGLIAVTNLSVYNFNSDAKFDINTFRGQHFQYRNGYDEAMRNKTEMQNELDSQSESDGLIYTLMKEINAIQSAFCRKFLQAFGYSEPPSETSEDQFYLPEVPKLADLVHDMLRKFQSSQNNKGFVLIVNGGELQEHCGTEEAVNLKNAVMTAMTETDPAATLIVVTSSCPEDNTNEPLDITTKVYAQGPGSKELIKAEFLWNIPTILSRILQTGFGATPTPADIPRDKLSPIQNNASREANSWNYGKTQATDNVKNKDHKFAFPEQTENFNDVEINISAKQPEYQMKPHHIQDTMDENYDQLLKYIAEILKTTKTDDDSDEMNTHLNNDAQEIISYLENIKKESRGKPVVTNLPVQHIKANENLPKFVALNETGVQKHNVLLNTAKDTPASEEKHINLDKMLLNTEHLNNSKLLSSATQNQNSSEQGLNANILIKNNQHNAEKENTLGNRSLPNKVAIHEKYPSSNVQLYKPSLTYPNYP